MFHGRTVLLVLALAAAILAQEQEQTNGREDPPQYTHIIHEEFLPLDEEGVGQHFLRGRELQTTTTCQAFTPAPVYVCGMPYGHLELFSSKQGHYRNAIVS